MTKVSRSPDARRHPARPSGAWRDDHHGKKLSGRMLDAAVELARRSGAQAAGYPGSATTV
ncbi:hypothetical protein FVA77_25710 [Phyllobacterium endophyticum]|nr:hypothetical protein FVA77_25710 [Phyllobacterium endophyticum]